MRPPARFVIAAVCAGHLLIAMSGCRTSTRPGDTVSRLQYWNQRLAAELPTGTARSAVEAFLVRHGLTPDYSPTDRAVVAFERNVETSGLVTAHIRIHCPLDSGQRLLACRASLIFSAR